MLWTALFLALLPSVRCIRSFRRKGQAPSYKANSVQEAWDNHLAAFGGGDVDRILLDYDDSSVLRVYAGGDDYEEHKTLDAIETFFTDLFERLKTNPPNDPPKVPVQVVESNVVWLVWSVPGINIQQATDFFIFGENNKIRVQHIVVESAQGASMAQIPTQGASMAQHTHHSKKGTRPLPYSAASVEEAWKNHFDAFAAQDVTKILLDYSESSVIRVWDGESQEKYIGVSGAKGFFTELFADLKDTTTLGVKVQLKSESPKNVWLVWTCTSSGLTQATDFFTFDENNKILQQDIVVTWPK